MEMFNCSCENSPLASLVEMMLKGVGIPLVGGMGIVGNLAIIFGPQVILHVFQTFIGASGKSKLQM